MLLNGQWNLSGLGLNDEPICIAGTVPGCVHTDLQRAGLLGDIFWRDNSKSCRWIEDRDFTYTKTFTVEDPAGNAWIEFDGLDTYCDVLLNGKQIGAADNMHIPYAFPVDGVLRDGENVLQVKFRSAVREVAGFPQAPAAFTAERLRTRRIQCTYSWDWVDRFVTCGIYRDVRLVFRNPNEIDNVYVYTKNINPYAAQLHMDIAIRDIVPETDWVHIEIADPDGRTVFEKSRKILTPLIGENIDIRDAKLWYPAGYGAQSLYTIKVSTPTSGKQFRYGIRELTILQLEDLPGSEEETLCREIQNLPFVKEFDRNRSTAGFTLLCNGVKIMCKGGNWVPCEPFPSNETPEKIRRLLSLAVLGNVNMLRVWGGGIFERDEFYDICDELGILVTQDFLMACGTYPEKEQWFLDALAQETKAAALRLRNHACLAWWSGDNENAVHGNENKTDFDGYTAATYGILPTLREYDPMRYFLPSSPYGGDMYSSATRGTTHNTFYLGAIFQAIRESDLSEYRDLFGSMYSRFSAEQAALGLPFVSSLRKFMTEEDIFGEDRTVSEFHTKNNPGLDLSLFEYINIMTRKLFGEYTDGKDRARKQQMLHCEWIRVTLEAHRIHKWFSSGILYWMYNDCWPAANGWSIVDYYARPKPAFYAFQRAAKPVIVSLEKKNGNILVHCCNDSLETVSGEGKLYLHDIHTGENLWESVFAIQTDVNSSAVVHTVPYSELRQMLTNGTVLICDAETNLGNDRAFFLEGRFCDLDLDYTEAEIISREAEEITVRAKSFTPFVLLDEEKLLEENCFMLKTGETKTVRFVW